MFIFPNCLINYNGTSRSGGGGGGVWRMVRVWAWLSIKDPVLSIMLCALHKAVGLIALCNPFASAM